MDLAADAGLRRPQPVCQAAELINPQKPEAQRKRRNMNGKFDERDVWEKPNEFSDPPEDWKEKGGDFTC